MSNPGEDPPDLPMSEIRHTKCPTRKGPGKTRLVVWRAGSCEWVVPIESRGEHIVTTQGDVDPQRDPWPDPYSEPVTDTVLNQSGVT